MDADVRDPNQSSVAKAFSAFDKAGLMRPSAYYARIVDLMEGLVRFTVLLRPHGTTLTDCHSERKAAARKADRAADLSAVAVAVPP